MCGATSAQTQLQDEQIQAYQTAQTMTQEEYGNQQAIYGPMAQQFQSIFNLGPSQEGFSAGEKNTLNAQAVTGTGENYSNAAKALNEQIAGEGGGNESIPSGANTQLKEQVAQRAAQEESSEETQIQEADYNQGRADWQAAGEGLTSIAAGENPLGYENAATGSGTAASNTANQVAQEQNSWVNAAIGAAGSVGGAFLDGFSQAPGGQSGSGVNGAGQAPYGSTSD